MDEVLSINPVANLLVFNVHNKEWLTYFRGNDRPGEPCYNVSIWNDLTQVVNFPTLILDSDSQSPSLLKLYIYSDAGIGSTLALPPLGNSGHVVVSPSIDFPWNLKWDAPFYRIGYDHSWADFFNLCDHLWNVSWEGIIKLSASAAASEFCEWVQTRIDAYIAHTKNQLKPHSFPWFPPACAAAIVLRNYVFRLF